MPTAARMISAICLAALAWVVSEQIKTLFEEDKVFGFFNMINLVLGFVIGWQVIGSRAGRGYSAAINNGLTAIVMTERLMRLPACSKLCGTTRF
jgi:hypothetical protein